MIKVGVGSNNPVKIKATEAVFKALLDKNTTVKGVSVSSGVSDQPMSIEACYQGALQRAENVLKKGKFDYAVGIEGGVNQFSFGWVTQGVIVILNKEGKQGVGMSAALPLDEEIIKKLKKGEELGDLIEEDSGIENVKQKQGAFGLYTNGYVTRQKGYEHGVAFALSRFLV